MARRPVDSGKRLPAARAQKPRDFKAEYARRMAGKAKGTPEYQRARGHKAAEHVERQRREEVLKEATGKLTSAEVQNVKRAVTRLHNEMPGLGNLDDMIARGISDATKMGGYKEFKEELDYRRQIARTPGETPMAVLEWRSAALDGFSDVRWYWYHTQTRQLRMAS